MGFWRTSSSLQGLCIVGALQLLWVLSSMHGSFAQTSTCDSTATLTPLQPCLPYIQAGNTTIPASNCCTPLRTLLNSSDPTCICQIAPLAQQLGVTINQTRALEIAALCNQTVPSSVRSCLTAAASSPSGTSSSPPPPSTSSQGNTNNSSHGSHLFPPSLLLIGSIFVALLLHLGMYVY